MAEVQYVNGAGGSISPSVFVVTDTTNSKSVNQASTTTAAIVGVSQEWSKYAPLPNASVVAADAVGDPIKIYNAGEICLLTSTSAGWTAGDFLTATTGGKGLTTTSSGNFVGALALTTVVGSGLGQVIVQPASSTVH